jgi:steroid delta-isomerase-like uncharacterized protein
MSAPDEQLRKTIDDYNSAWNAHDVARIATMHAPDMVFENHTAGERAEGDQALAHIAQIFESWPDIEFKTRRLYVREDLVVQEWTASATHVKQLSRGEIVAEPSGKRIEWNGMDVIPFERGKVKRKDVYSDSVSILRHVGLLSGRLGVGDAPGATRRARAQRDGSAGREHEHDRREAFQRAHVHDPAGEQLDADERQQDGDRLIHVEQALARDRDEREQRSQPEQREQVAGQQQRGVV